MDCPICCTPYTTTLRAPINCLTCEDDQDKTCLECAKTYILNSSGEASCMFCKQKWDREFLFNNFPQTFVNKDIKKIKEKVLYEKEIARLPETQIYAQQELKIRELDRQIKLAKSRSIEIKEELKKQNDLVYQLTRKMRNINCYSTEKPVKCFTYRCPREDCMGFLSDKFTCGLCSDIFCKDCMESIDENSDHVCNEEKKESIKFLKKDTKPCPSCGEFIHKINGCDQMWCTQCKTAFSWKSGTIETKNVHNPEYYRWMRENRQHIPREPGDVVVCDGLPNHYKLLDNSRALLNNIDDVNTLAQRMHRGFNNRNNDCKDVILLFNAHRYLVHVDRVELRINLEAEKDEQLKKIRVSYLLKELNDSKFKNKLQVIDKKYSKLQAFRDIYALIRTVLIENLGRISDMDTNPRSFPERSNVNEINEILLNLKTFRTFLNKSFETIGVVYKCVYPGILEDWRTRANMKQ